MRELGRFLKVVAFVFVAGCSSEDCNSSEPGGSTCCKVCMDSKPCGDSCIPRNQTCHKFGGCACNNDDPLFYAPTSD